MTDLENVRMFINKDTEIGVAAKGAYEAGRPRSLAGLREIQWNQVDPEQFIGSIITLRGTIVGGGEGPFINDMTMTQIDGGAASFES